MDRRDYIIIFCLLLPFFITLPLYLTTRSQLVEQREITERVRDSLFVLQYRQDRMAKGNAAPAPIASFTSNEESASPEEVPVETVSAVVPEQPASAPTSPVTTAASTPLTPEPVKVRVAPPAVNPAPARAAKQQESKPAAADVPVAAPIMTTYAAKRGKASSRTLAQVSALADNGIETSGHQLMIRLDTNNNKQTLSFSCLVKELPGEYQGAREVYLVITDSATGDLIDGLDGIKATVPVGGVAVPVWSAIHKRVTLRNNYRLSLQTEIAQKIAAGTYLVELFTDAGPLAKAVFQFERSPAAMLGERLTNVGSPE